MARRGASAIVPAGSLVTARAEALATEAAGLYEALVTVAAGP